MSNTQQQTPNHQSTIDTRDTKMNNQIQDSLELTQPQLLMLLASLMLVLSSVIQAMK